MTRRPIAIYGAGGFGREVAWLLDVCSASGWDAQLHCFIDDSTATQGTYVHGTPVLSLADAAKQFPGAFVVAGIGAPRIRQALIERAVQAGFQPLTVVHPGVEQSTHVVIGEGTLICAGNILTTDIVLGAQVQINLACTIGHDVQLGDYTTLAPGVHVSGCVVTGKCVYIGTGAVIVNGTSEQPIIIEDDAVIGAGACVTKSVPANLTVVGVPARPLVK
jgi:sugar O-acyltransferase (sialic acid O-acetyltransferase NeuD family)